MFLRDLEIRDLEIDKKTIIRVWQDHHHGSVVCCETSAANRALPFARHALRRVEGVRESANGIVCRMLTGLV